MDAIGISTGSGVSLETTGQLDTAMSQMVAIGASATQTIAFATLATVVSLRATVPCWYSVGAVAIANAAGSDYLPANTTWLLKIPQGAVLSFIQAAGAGWVSVTPLANPQIGAIPGTAFDWDFTSGALPAGMTFTRSTVAWYFNSAGVLTSAAINAPRFDYDPISLQPRGLLIEPAINNLCLWNRDLTNAAWVKTNATAAKTQTGIDGVASSASAITASAANGTVLQSFTIASSPRTLSAYVKRLIGSGVVNVTLDGVTWTPITVTSGWTRFVNITQTVTNPNIGFQIVTSGDSIAVDAVQMDNTSYSTSPILTTSAGVTRQVDSAALTPIPWFNASAGTFLAQFDCGLVPVGINQTSIQLDDGTSNNRFALRAQNTWDGIVIVGAGTVYQSVGPVQKVPGSGPVKDAIAYPGGAGGYAAQAAAAGVLLTTNSSPSTSLPSGINRLSLGPLSAWVRRVTYWNVALSNAQLQAVTSDTSNAIALAVAAYSLRQLNPLAYSGPAIQVRRSTDNALANIGFVGGNLDTTSLGTFLGAATGFVTTWYDQSGTGNHLTQPTAANQPTIVTGVTALGGRPAILFGNNLGFYLFVNQNASLQGLFANGGTASFVTNLIDTSSVNLNRLWQRGAQMHFRFSTGPSLTFVQQASTTSGSWNWTMFPPGGHVVDLTYSYASLSNVPSVAYDGTTQTVTSPIQPVGTISDAGNPQFSLGGANVNLGWNGHIAEAIFWKSLPSLPPIRAWQKAYWGTP